MSEPLVDLRRLRITPLTAQWLRAVAHITGKSAPEIARDALHEAAVQAIEAAKQSRHDANVLLAITLDEGQRGDTKGTAKGRASD